jgi:ring-1,2-phenylacetyl-CoA epoxidase subunit PaaB
VRTYELFVKPAGKDPFEHAGSLEAPDDELALVYARETYVRRGEAVDVWVVDRRHVLHLPDDQIEPNRHRPHATNDGHVVAERRRRKRAETESGRDTAAPAEQEAKHR